MFGFIILRHVSQRKHNRLWKECYRCIRELYPDTPIMMIDDGSNEELLDHMNMDHVTIVKSEYPGAGELLPYFYLWKLHPFDRAIILHDSMFIKKKVDLDRGNKFLWHFEDHRWDRTDLEVEMLLALNNRKALLDLYCKKDLWMGCFGAAMMVDTNVVTTIFEKEGMERLLPMIKSREHRMALERVVAVIMQAYRIVSPSDASLYGNIHSMERAFTYTMDDYMKDEDHPPMVKVWSGR